MNVFVPTDMGKELHFKGKANLDGLIASLKANEELNFSSASDVVVSGGSAGGKLT